jgi:hypothetical protein
MATEIAAADLNDLFFVLIPLKKLCTKTKEGGIR